jgi:hypothetical protein
MYSHHAFPSLWPWENLLHNETHTSSREKKKKTKKRERERTFIIEAGNLNVSSNLDGLGGQTTLNVQKKGLTEISKVKSLEDFIRLVKGQLESVVSVAVLGVQRPSKLFVKILNSFVVSLGKVLHDGVDLRAFLRRVSTPNRSVANFSFPGICKNF